MPSLCLFLLLATQAPAPPDAAPAPEAPAAKPADPYEQTRDALFDYAFEALVSGNLVLAERAFQQAANLPGDPVRREVAASFVQRVRRLRARQDVRVAPRALVPTPRPVPRSERAAFLATTTVLGLGLYGWTLPGALGLEPGNTTRAFVGVYMLTASSSFILPYLFTQDRVVTPGEVHLAFYGGTRGIWHGVLFGAVLAGNLGPDQRERGWMAAMFAGSLLELLGGYQLASAGKMSAGEARTMAVLGDFGLLWGFGTGYLLRLDDREDPDTQARGMAAAGLIGAGLGLGGGWILAHRRDNSWGDGEVMRASMGLGAWLGLAAADLGKTSFSLQNRTFTSLLMGGGAAGLVAGDWLVRDTSFGPGQALLVDLAMVSGGLLGAGVTYLVAGDQERPPYWLTSGVGAGIGFGLSYWAIRDLPDNRPARLSAVVMPMIGRHGERGVSVGGLF
jgi:hypothetical protein